LREYDFDFRRFIFRPRSGNGIGPGFVGCRYVHGKSWFTPRVFVSAVLVGACSTVQKGVLHGGNVRRVIIDSATHSSWSSLGIQTPMPLIQRRGDESDESRERGGARSGSRRFRRRGAGMGPHPRRGPRGVLVFSPDLPAGAAASRHGLRQRSFPTHWADCT